MSVSLNVENEYSLSTNHQETDTSELALIGLLFKHIYTDQELFKSNPQYQETLTHYLRVAILKKGTDNVFRALQKVCTDPSDYHLHTQFHYWLFDQSALEDTTLF